MHLIVIARMRNQSTEVGVDLMICNNFKFHDMQFGMASSFLDDLTYFFSIMKAEYRAFQTKLPSSKRRTQYKSCCGIFIIILIDTYECL